MFCDKCGAAVQADQRFCSRCGREFTGTMAVGYPRRSRVQEHIRLLGILWLALSAFNAVGAVVLYIIANTLFLHLHESSGPPLWLHPFLGFIAIMILAKAAAGFVIGWGLLQREPWARILTIILAFLALFNVPFGTALGIYTLWVLLPAESDQEYEKEVRSVSAA
jgi:phage shock protein PspC (stress-responsive transcriptional regulator)